MTQRGGKAMSRSKSTVSSSAKAITFRETVQPYTAAGWRTDALLPAKPGTKRPGRWLGSRWVGLKGSGLLKEGLQAATHPTTWEDMQAWPTDGVCVLGRDYVGLDVDSESPALFDLVTAAVPGLAWHRARGGSRRVLFPFRATEVVTSWRPILFVMPDSDAEQAIELNANGKQWLAAGTHPSGERYAWVDSVGPSPTPPPIGELPELGQVEADEIRVRLVIRLRAAGARFLKDSDQAEATHAGSGERVLTDDLEPTLPIEMIERILEAIPDTRETVGGWDEAVKLLASMRYVLGREGAFLPEAVEAWACAFEDSGPEWIEARWRSFDGGVEAQRGTFLEWVRQHGPELYEEAQRHVDRGEALAAFGAIEEDDEDDGEDGPQGRQEPLLEHTPTEVEAAAFILRATPLRGVLGYCEFRHQMVLRRPIPTPDGKIPNDWAERPWTDTDDLALLMWCQANGARKMKKGVAQDAAAVVAQRHPFHPVRDYLKGLRWDGTPRLDGWLAGYAKATGDAAYLAAVGRATMIAAVARVMRPGEKVDTVLVLEGKQGIGKSSLFQAMVPDPSWFSDSMPHDLASKDARAHLRGKWFIELPELAQFKRTELAALKGFLTTATDTYRPSYGRHEVTVARQCVFVASTNEDEYLADATGGRRYWPVALEGEVDLAGIRRDRDQLWAEAAEAFGRGEAWWITDKALLPAVERVQASRKVGDGWDQIVADYVATKGVNAIVAEDFLMDVIKLDPAVLHVSHLRRIGEIMRGMGWTRQAVRQEDGRQRKGWVRPIVLRGVANDGVADARGRDDDLIERDDAPRKRDHLKVVRPQLRPGEA
jgi:hypothetical protein